LEAALGVGSKPDDFLPVRGQNRERGLIGLVGAFLSHLHDRTHWANEDLSLKAAIGGCESNARTGGHKDEQQNGKGKARHPSMV